MKKKFLKILALSSLMITGVGVVANGFINGNNEVVQRAEAATQVVETFSFTDPEAKPANPFTGSKGTEFTATEVASVNHKANSIIDVGKEKTYAYGFTIAGNKHLTFTAKYAWSAKILSIVTMSKSGKKKIGIKLSGSGTTNAKVEGNLGSATRKAGEFHELTIAGGTAGEVTIDRFDNSTAQSAIVEMIITYEAYEYNVDFYDGETKKDEFCQTVMSGKTVKVGEYELTSKPGFDFGGWSTTSDGKNIIDLATYEISQDTSLYAVWNEVNHYTVTFMSEGKVVGTQEVNENEYATQPNDPTHSDGFILLYWTLDGKQYDFANTPVTGPITLHAEWEVKEYATGVKILKDGVEINESEETIMLEPTENITLSYKAIGNSNVNFNEKWSSDNPSAVSVDSNGKLTYVNYGLANITITLYPDSTKPVTCTVKVQTTKDIYDKTTTLSFADASKKYFANGGAIEDSGQSFNRTYDEVLNDLQKTAGLDMNNPTSVFSLYKGSLEEYKWNDTNSSCIGNEHTLELTGYVHINAASAGTLKVNFGVNKNPGSRGVTLTDMDGKEIAVMRNTDADNKNLVLHQIDIPRAGEYKLVIEEKIWCESISFVEETHYFEPIVLQSQKGVVENKNVVNFVATISRDAAKYCKEVYFTLNINGTSNGQQFVKENYVTKKVNRVYTSYSYTKSDGTVKTLNDATMAYFVYSLSGIPSDFAGEISATAHSTDINGQTKSSLVAVEKF